MFDGARSLNLSPSAVSKQIRRLEDRLGVRLLNRSTRRITLTDEGRVFYERARRIAEEVSEAEETIISMGSQVRGTLNDGELKGPDGVRTLRVDGNFEANSADAVYHAALAGLGIARLSTYLVGKDLQEGRLVQLLPEYVHQNADILAVYPERRNLSPKVRAFIDFLMEHLAALSEV